MIIDGSYKLSFAVFALLICSCYQELVVSPGEGLSDWSAPTHGPFASPNYDIVYPQEAVNRIDIVIDSEYWAIMQEDLASIVGGGGGPGKFSDETPVVVPCEYHFNGIEWHYVGIRFKGNSSLNSAYNQGISKLPLRLDFHALEDEHPEISGQTFYGFQEISLSNNFDDASVLREKIGADIFRGAGVPAPETSFYRVYIDHGDGPVYFGLYTMVEVVFDTMIGEQYGSNTGNCYKPDGNAASWAAGMYSTGELENKTNGGDYSDVQKLYDALHDDTRTSAPDAWKRNLETVFNVDKFLHYLAVNTTIQNWDTYGVMPHNYYLYNADGTLHWIPWDNNEALQEGKMGGSLSFDFVEIDERWPLIEYLMAQGEYLKIYDRYIEELIEGVFAPSSIQATYQYYHFLIEPYVIGSDGEISGHTFTSSARFQAALNELHSHALAREAAARAYLDGQP